MAETHQGRCFCGAIEIELAGPPEEMGYCHCTSCRTYTGAALVAFALFRSEKVKVTKGAELLRGFNKTGMSDRQSCTRCGGHLMTGPPGMGFIDVYAATIPTLPFKPVVHLNYAEAVLRITDGLPKLRDFPATVGGSGKTVPE